MTSTLNKSSYLNVVGDFLKENRHFFLSVLEHAVPFRKKRPRRTILRKRSKFFPACASITLRLCVCFFSLPFFLLQPLQFNLLPFIYIVKATSPWRFRRFCCAPYAAIFLVCVDVLFAGLVFLAIQIGNLKSQILY